MRGLRGATVNHLYLMRNRNFAAYVVMVAACLLAYFITQNENLGFFSQILLLLTMPMAVLESSEIAFISKWNAFEKAFGIAPFWLVISRYLIFIITSFACAGLYTVLQMSEIYFVLDSGFWFLTAHLMGIAYIPIMYALNPRKKSTSFVILMAATVVAAFISQGFIITLDNVLITVAVVAGLYVASAGLSVFLAKIYRGSAA